MVCDGDRCTYRSRYRLWGSMTDDPHDDSAHWAGQLPRKTDDGTKRTDKRDPGREKQSDVQRQESRVAETQQTPHRTTD